jgi:protocatechuate 3,4-dioxygenase beta subunit
MRLNSWLTAVAVVALSTVVAQANVTITGTFLDKAGAPVANAQVRLAQPMTSGGAVGPGSAPQSIWGIGEFVMLQGKAVKVIATTTTDANGRFTFQNVAAGRYQILAGTGARAARDTVNVEDGKNLDVKLQVK